MAPVDGIGGGRVIPQTKGVATQQKVDHLRSLSGIMIITRHTIALLLTKAGNAIEKTAYNMTIYA